MARNIVNLIRRHVSSVTKVFVILQEILSILILHVFNFLIENNINYLIKQLIRQ